MSIEGWYYLHTNGSLIYKHELGGTAADIRESDFARAMWPCDPTDREGAWRILVEALSLGANAVCVKELSEKWGCDDADAANYADRLGLRLCMDGNAWCATFANADNIQDFPCGFGDTALEAMAELCRELGYKSGKMWNATFKDLCTRKITQ